MRARRLLFVGVLASIALASTSTTARADELAGHTVVLDGQGKLLPWASYDRVMQLSWSYLESWPRVEANGLKTYLAYPTFDPTTLAGGNYPNIPAGNHAMTTESAIRTFAYRNDLDALRVMKEMLDHHLAHGTSPASYVYGSMPWASSDPGQVDYAGSSWCDSTCGSGDGVGVTEPDKGAELGYAYLEAFEATNDSRYRDAAIAIGDTLVRTRRDGDATHSPWPFRVVAMTGAPKEEYASNYAGALMLFDELVRLDAGNVAGYRAARDALWAWLLANPFRTNFWSGGFEDQMFFNDPAHDKTQYIPQKIAQYLLERPEIDPSWRTDLAGILPWVEQNFGNDTATEKGVQYGANVISEQDVYPVKMGNHTARYASVAALWAERTGDASWGEKAYRSLNWATYVCRPSGLVSFSVNINEFWFATGYGDYVRNFMSALGASPSFAPPHENHILRTSSVVQSVTYEPTAVRYRTFHPASIDVLRVAFRPSAFTADGRTLAQRSDLEAEGFTLEDLGGGDFAVRVRHDGGNDLAVSGAASPPPTEPAPRPAPSTGTGTATATATSVAASGSGCGCEVGQVRTRTSWVWLLVGVGVALRRRSHASTSRMCRLRSDSG